MAAVDELGYRPSGVARSLRMRRTRTLGLIVTDIQNPFFPELVQAADDAARDIGYSILLGSAAYDEHRAMHYLDLMVDRRVDGMIIASSQLSEASWQWLLPVAGAGRRRECGARGAAGHRHHRRTTAAGRSSRPITWSGSGHRRIAYIAGTAALTRRLRRAWRASGAPAPRPGSPRSTRRSSPATGCSRAAKPASPSSSLAGTESRPSPATTTSPRSASSARCGPRAGASRPTSA